MGFLLFDVCMQNKIELKNKYSIHYGLTTDAINALSLVHHHLPVFSSETNPLISLFINENEYSKLSYQALIQLRAKLFQDFSFPYNNLYSALYNLIDIQLLQKASNHIERSVCELYSEYNQAKNKEFWCASRASNYHQQFRHAYVNEDNPQFDSVVSLQDGISPLGHFMLFKNEKNQKSSFLSPLFHNNEKILGINVVGDELNILHEQRYDVDRDAPIVKSHYSLSKDTYGSAPSNKHDCVGLINKNLGTHFEKLQEDEQYRYYLIANAKKTYIAVTTLQSGVLVNVFHDSGKHCFPDDFIVSQLCIAGTRISFNGFSRKEQTIYSLNVSIHKDSSKDETNYINHVFSKEKLLINEDNLLLEDGYSIDEQEINDVSQIDALESLAGVPIAKLEKKLKLSQEAIGELVKEYAIEAERLRNLEKTITLDTILLRKTIKYQLAEIEKIINSPLRGSNSRWFLSSENSLITVLKEDYELCQKHRITNKQIATVLRCIDHYFNIGKREICYNNKLFKIEPEYRVSDIYEGKYLIVTNKETGETFGFTSSSIECIDMYGIFIDNCYRLRLQVDKFMNFFFDSKLKNQPDFNKQNLENNMSIHTQKNSPLLFAVNYSETNEYGDEYGDEYGNVSGP